MHRKALTGNTARHSYGGRQQRGPRAARRSAQRWSLCSLQPPTGGPLSLRTDGISSPRGQERGDCLYLDGSSRARAAPEATAWSPRGRAAGLATSGVVPGVQEARVTSQSPLTQRRGCEEIYSDSKYFRKISVGSRSQLKVLPPKRFSLDK